MNTKFARLGLGALLFQLLPIQPASATVVLFARVPGQCTSYPQYCSSGSGNSNLKGMTVASLSSFLAESGTKSVNIGTTVGTTPPGTRFGGSTCYYIPEIYTPEHCNICGDNGDGNPFIDWDCSDN